jgi:hypothetical protein
LDIDWTQISDVGHLIIGCDDGSVQAWRLVDDGDGYQLRLRWSSMNSALTLKDATIQDVRGLSQVNERLLKQRGAVGEPTHRYRDASKKFPSMVSAIFKSSVHNADKEPLVANSSDLPVEPVEQHHDS